MAGSRQNQDTRSICIQPVGRPGAMRAINDGHDVLKGIAIESAAWVHGQGRRLIDDDNGFVFVNDLDIGIHIRLDNRLKPLIIAFAGLHPVVGTDRLVVAIEKPTICNSGGPFGRINVWQDTAHEVLQ